MKKTVEERFWSKVDRSGGEDTCWPWLAARQPEGYGRFWVDGKWDYAHIYSYQIATGNRPEEILHECDNPCCCNPRHLRGGTHPENIADMYRKGRRRQLKGEDHVRCLYTDADIEKMRVLRSQGVTAKAIAAMYSMSYDYLGKLLRRERRA